jgi:hypothetical protein
MVLLRYNALEPILELLELAWFRYKVAVIVEAGHAYPGFLRPLWIFLLNCINDLLPELFFQIVGKLRDLLTAYRASQLL